jgi:hypothetical protein
VSTSRTSRLSDFFDSYTKDLTAEDLQRLFTRDARDAYKFFTRGVDAEALARMPWHKRFATEVRLLFIAFSMKLSPARRVVFGAALLLAADIAIFFGVVERTGPIGLVAFPIAVWEFSLGVYLTVKGFRPAAVAALSPAAGATPAVR